MISIRILVAALVTGLTAFGLPYLFVPTPADKPVSLNQPTHQEIATDEFHKVAGPFLQKWCIRCHQGTEAEAGLDLSEFDSQVAVNGDLEAWEEIMEALDDQYMPPSDEPQPREEQVQKLKEWYFKTLQANDQHSVVVPQMRRLNRVEYENTIADLLRIDALLFTNSSRILLTDDYFNPSTREMPRYVLAMSHFSYIQKRPPLFTGLPNVPSDPPVEHGFSNDYTALSCSPLQIERYFELANGIINAEEFPRHSGLWDSMFLPATGDIAPDQQKQTARQRLNIFLQRAFRRPVTSEEVDLYSRLFNQELDRTRSHTQAMSAAVTAILVSPAFLFRQDFSEDSFDESNVDPYAMANRLSYFLWASMPDDQLFQSAREGRLNTPSGIVREVRRMMKHKKIKSLAADFGTQWLKIASVNSVRPDKDLFPEFYYTKQFPPSVSMMVEQLLYFETILVEDRNIMEFVHSDWGYVNRPLMDWYRLNPKKVLGFTPDPRAFEDFFRIKWPNLHKGGVITSGATMVSTSATARTSPVYRGAWILDVIFNRPPPSPPADVPALEDIDKMAERPVNVRERLQMHREDQNCAVCHDRIDPLGFALEKFDTIGRFRKTYEKDQPIDATGTIFGEPFEGPARFKAVIMRNEREFVQGFTEHMLKYALGRQLELTDEKEVAKVVDAVMQRGNNFSAVVEEIVTSDLFRAPPQKPGQ